MQAFLLNLSALNNFNMIDELPQLGTTSPTLSGMSSGGFMTSQMHVTYSNIFKGAGIFAGGPFMCSMGAGTIYQDCSKTPENISVQKLQQTAWDFWQEGKIANPELLRGQPVYLFVGTKDTNRFPGVLTKTKNFYEGSGADVELVNNVPAVHTFPTNFDFNKIKCDELKEPWVSNCNYDGAGAMFKKILPNQRNQPLQEPEMSWQMHGDLLQFDQHQYVNGDLPEIESANLAQTGYIYVPHNCKDHNSGCRVHMSLHGCKQSSELVGTDYITKTGYLQYAASNDIVVLFPQAQPNEQNVNGCWDVVGMWNKKDFATNRAVQQDTLMRMIKRVSSSKQSTLQLLRMDPTPIILL